MVLTYACLVYSGDIRTAFPHDSRANCPWSRPHMFPFNQNLTLKELCSVFSLWPYNTKKSITIVDTGHTRVCVCSYSTAFLIMVPRLSVSALEMQALVSYCYFAEVVFAHCSYRFPMDTARVLHLLWLWVLNASFAIKFMILQWRLII